MMILKPVFIIAIVVSVLIGMMSPMNVFGQYSMTETSGPMMIDKTEYYSGETIKISGNIQNVIRGISVDLVLTNPDGFTEKFRTPCKTNGDYSMTLQINSEYELGEYSIASYYNSKFVGEKIFSIMTKSQNNDKSGVMKPSPELIRDYDDQNNLVHIMKGTWMEPTIKNGDILFVEKIPFENIKIGDIIIYQQPAYPDNTGVSRVVTILDNNPKTIRASSGDAYPDKWVAGMTSPITEKEYVGKVIKIINNEGEMLEIKNQIVRSQNSDNFLQNKQNDQDVMIGVMIPSVLGGLYYDDEYSFSIEYPDEWTVKHGDVTEGGVNFMDGVEQCTEKIGLNPYSCIWNTNVNVSFYPDIGAQLSDPEEREYQIMHQRDTCENATYDSLGDFTCTGFEVSKKFPSTTVDNYRIITTQFGMVKYYPDDPNTGFDGIIQLTSYIYNENDLWVINSESDEDVFDEHEKLLWNMINSFKYPTTATPLYQSPPQLTLPEWVSDPEITSSKTILDCTPNSTYVPNETSKYFLINIENPDDDKCTYNVNLYDQNNLKIETLGIMIFSEAFVIDETTPNGNYYITLISSDHSYSESFPLNVQHTSSVQKLSSPSSESSSNTIVLIIIPIIVTVAIVIVFVSKKKSKRASKKNFY